MIISIKRFCNILLWAVTFLCPFLSFSQTIIKSPENLDDFSLGYTKVIGQDENGYFVLTSNLSYELESDRSGFRSRKYKVAYFSTSLIKNWEMNIEPVKPDAELRSVEFFGGKPLLISTIWKKEDKTLSVYATPLDPGLKQIANPAPLTSCETSGNPERIITCSSLHKEKLAVNLLFSAGNERTGIASIIINNDLSLFFKTVTVIGQPRKAFDLQNAVVSDSGTFFLLGLRSEKTKVLSSKRDLSWFLYSCDSEEIHEYPLGRNLELNNLSMAMDEFNQKAVVAGFYNNKDSFIGSGIFYSTSDGKGDPVVNMSAIDDSQNLRLKGARNKSGDIGLSGYPIRKIIPRGDGGAVIVAELAYTSEYSYFDSFSQTYTRRLEYNFGDIIAFSVSASGIADWSASIQKDQVSMDDGGIFSSFCMLIKGNSLGFLFAEPIGKRSKVIPYSVSYTGVPTKVTSAGGSEGMQLLPTGARQISQNELLVPVVIKRSLYLVRFSF